MKWPSFQFKLNLLCVFMLGFAANLNAQEYLESKPLPDGMGAIQNISSNVNHSTGVVNIQVPSCGVNYAGIQVPVTLNYQTSGIKVDAEETCVGLGWNLSAGGKITRIVNKYPDESVTGFLNHSYHTFNTVETYVFARSGSRPSNSKYKKYNDFDGEPDLFYFEIPGKSGMFVFDEKWKAHTIPYQPISIKWYRSGSVSYFIIIDTDGIQDKFGETEASKDISEVKYENDNIDGDEKNTYISTWHLEQIETQRKEQIYFKYQPGKTKK